MTPPVTINDLIKRVETETPALWSAVYPRVYENVGNWNSPKVAACALANAIFAAAAVGTSHGSVRNQLVAACAVDAHDVPTYFVTTELLRAAEATTLPEEFTWTDDLKMPHPGLVFIFEKGAVKHPTCGEIGFVAVARISPGKLRHKFLHDANLDCPVSAFVTLTAAHEDPYFSHFDLSLSSDTNVRASAIANAPSFPGEPTEDFIVELTADDKKFNGWLATLAIKLVAVMNARPEAVSAGARLRTVKPKRPGDKPREFWSPNIIGRDYKAQRENHAAGELAGVKKRMHWRRGHFARQPFGEGRLQRKTIWREPVLVGEPVLGAPTSAT